jgi:hypothetical protein
MFYSSRRKKGCRFQWQIVAAALLFVSVPSAYGLEADIMEDVHDAATSSCVKEVLADVLKGEPAFWMRRWEDHSSAFSDEGVLVQGYYDNATLRLVKVYMYGSRSLDYIACRFEQSGARKIVYVKWARNGLEELKPSKARVECIRALTMIVGDKGTDCIEGPLLEGKEQNKERIQKILYLATEKLRCN